jgi:hypothetical protein
MEKSSSSLPSGSSKTRSNPQHPPRSQSHSSEQTLEDSDHEQFQHRRTYRTRITTEEKLDIVFNFLQTEVHWLLSEFIVALSKSTDNKNARRRSAFETAVYNTPEILLRFLDSGSAKPATRHAVLDALEWGRPEFRNEVLELGKTELFGHYNPDIALTLKDLQPNTILERIAVTAPLFLETLQYIAKQARTDNPQRENDHSSRFVMLLAILCFTQRQTGSSNLPTNLGLHFLARGSKVREIDLLAHFGISVSYKTVQRALKSQRDCEATKVASMGSSEWAVTAYDNFEQVEGVKSQRLEDNSTFFSVTTGEVLRGMDIPPGGLQQDMFDKTVQLGIKDVLFTPGNKNDELEKDVSKSNIKVLNFEHSGQDSKL